MKPFAFFLTLLLAHFSLQAQLDFYVNYGGLYFCPEHKLLVYVDWDTDNHNANSVHWSSGGQRPIQMEMATQYTLTRREIQNDEYFIRIWNEQTPDDMYDCTFTGDGMYGRHTMTMGLQNADRTFSFVRIADMEYGYMDADTRQNEALVLTLSQIPFAVYDPEAQEYVYEGSVAISLMEDPQVIAVDIALPEDEDGRTEMMHFMCGFDQFFNLRFGIDHADRSRSAHMVRFEFLESNLLSLHFQSAAGERFATIALREYVRD